MAKVSTIAKNNRKAKLAKKYFEKRASLKKKILDESLSPEDRYEASVALQKLPKNSLPIRVRNRCSLTGRSQGYLRKFGLSRIKFRELALEGMLPGVTKASW